MENNLKIYDSKTRTINQFTPLKTGEVSLYVCGPTVQSSPHIGHMRVAVAFDTIRRFLMAIDYEVKFAQNVTDIDDKILHKSRDAKADWKDWAKRYEGEFFQAYDALNVLKPDFTPHATDYIAEQIALIEQIIANGYAYQGKRSDVWFDVEAFEQYGELTNQMIDDNLEVSEDDFHPEKHSPRDFALWKTVPISDPKDASWDSPWGKGRPGWHTECTAMSTSLLGQTFDIHGGGLDLRFPHHENELAQAKASGSDFANIWMHSAWVTAKGEKMSKSLGNGLNVFEVIRDSKLDALALRYALVTVHYRSMLEWTPDTLPAATKAISRIHGYLVQNGGEKYTDDLVDNADISKFTEFYEAMLNDFNTAEAIAAIHIAMKQKVPVIYLRKALQILGIDPLSEQNRSIFIDGISNDFTAEEVAQIEQQIAKRAAAKASKDFALADQIRNQLVTQGIALIDTPEGTRFERA